MSEPECNVQTPSFWDRLGSVGAGAVLLLISAGLTYGAFFEAVPDDARSTRIQIVALLTAVWGMSVYFFASTSSRPRGQRVASVCGKVSGLGWVVFFLSMCIRDLLAGDSSDKEPSRGSATFVALLLSVLLLDLWFVYQHLRDSKYREMGKDDELSTWDVILFWPVFAFLMSVPSMLFLFVIIGITYLAERIGARFGHPFLGALCGPVLLILLFGILGMLSRRSDDGKPRPPIGKADDALS